MMYQVTPVTGWIVQCHHKCHAGCQWRVQALPASTMQQQQSPFYNATKPNTSTQPHSLHCAPPTTTTTISQPPPPAAHFIKTVEDLYEALVQSSPLFIC
jgi:hypothetical protein